MTATITATAKCTSCDERMIQRMYVDNRERLAVDSDALRHAEDQLATNITLAAIRHSRESHPLLPVNLFLDRKAHV